MFESKRHDESRSTLRLGFLLAGLVWAFAAAGYALGGEPQWSLAVGTATAAPQAPVEIPIVLTSRGAPVSAIAFSIEFDSSKLALDGGPTLGSKVEMPAPTMFTSSSWVGTEAGVIGVAVYDRTRPIGVLADGTVARVRFRPLAGSSGFAFVRVSSAKPYSASGPRGERLEGEIIPGGGVTIVPPAGSNAAAVTPPVARDGASEAPGPAAIATLAMPVASVDSGDGDARGTPLVLHNGGLVAATVRLTLLREAPADAAGPVELRIPPGATRTWNDAGLDLFGVRGARGALVIERSSDRIIAAGSSRTGAVVVAGPASTADATLIAIDWRADLAIANLDGADARYAIDLRDADGALVATDVIVVPARSVRRGIQLSAPGASGAAGVTAIIRPDGTPARYLAWAATPTPDSPPLLQIAR
ncbi:MAG TPA: cohesin domain-containing protein [Thermoanaerobaculia bacterium]